MKETHEFNWIKISLPGFYLAVILLFDWLFVLGTVTPFFVVIGLLWMALKYRPIVMIPWAFIYTLVVCNILLVPKIFIFFAGHPFNDVYLIQCIRAATYIIVGIASSYLCTAMDRLKKSESELNQILENLPWPILTSDADGRILYWNETAEKILPLLKENAALNYFDLLSPPDFQGRTITEYLKRFELQSSDKPLILNVNGNQCNAHTQLLAWTDTKVLLTILSKKDIKDIKYIKDIK
jgi:PAS domain S-box-containing protein